MDDICRSFSMALYSDYYFNSGYIFIWIFNDQRSDCFAWGPFKRKEN
jgi:hypothetical protein